MGDSKIGASKISGLGDMQRFLDGFNLHDVEGIVDTLAVSFVRSAK